ncbi:MAG TPA: nitrilase-related carbon-nitrogen hydrolase [Phycisphaerales bacterium]
MHAHLVQLDIAWEDRPTNHRRVAAMLEAAPPFAGDLIVLPEMFDTGFSFRLDITADRDQGTLRFLRDLAVQYRVTVHGSRTVLDAAGRGLNRTTVIGPEGTTLAEYDKRHPFSLGLPGKRECDVFAPGDRCVTYSWHCGDQSIAVCPLICYDLRFPELFREGLKAGAEMFVVPANWPDTRTAHWRALLAARAIENQAFVLGVNRAGGDPTLRYPGASMAIDPLGATLAEADAREQVIRVEIPRRTLDDWRTRFPAWREA